MGCVAHVRQHPRERPFSEQDRTHQESYCAPVGYATRPPQVEALLLRHGRRAIRQVQHLRPAALAEGARAQLDGRAVAERERCAGEHRTPPLRIEVHGQRRRSVTLELLATLLEHSLKVSAAEAARLRRLRRRAHSWIEPVAVGERQLVGRLRGRNMLLLGRQHRAVQVAHCGVGALPHRVRGGRRGCGQETSLPVTGARCGTILGSPEFQALGSPEA